MVMQYLIRGFSLLTYWRKKRKLGGSTPLLDAAFDGTKEGGNKELVKLLRKFSHGQANEMPKSEMHKGVS